MMPGEGEKERDNLCFFWIKIDVREWNDQQKVFFGKNQTVLS